MAPMILPTPELDFKEENVWLPKWLKDFAINLCFCCCETLAKKVFTLVT
jgi:hypothetical protein